ncbi:MAG: AgmX/PglI C-terminal domain-containing protein [Bacteriovoracaceae bacterium]|nr:AgmX/PglI C-terminal domain-containing protein [Bacteriovoracaceae bacterium]
MLANKLAAETRSFTLIIVNEKGLSESWAVSEGESYLVGSDPSCGICLKHPSVARRYGVLQIENGDLKFTRFSDKKNFLTKFGDSEWITCGEFRLQIPAIKENIDLINGSGREEDKKRPNLKLINNQNESENENEDTKTPRLPLIPKLNPQSKSNQKPELVKNINIIPIKKSTSNSTPHSSSVVFDESQFTPGDLIPIESDRERFQDYIDVNSQQVRALLPNKQKTTSEVLEVMFLSYGNIVNFELLPLNARYVNHLYSYVSPEMKKLLPQEQDWLSWKEGKLAITLPSQWRKLDSKSIGQGTTEKAQEFRMASGVNEIIIRRSQSLPGFILWLTWPGREEFLNFLKLSLGLFLPFMILSLFHVREVVEVKEKEETIVILRPEILEAPTPAPTPAPEIVKAEPTPEPPKPKPEPTQPPKKVVEKKPIPKIPKPVPEVKKPQPVQKTVVKKEPPKRLVVQAGPPKVGGTGPVNPRAAQDIAAKAQAQKIAQAKSKISSSLGFLSNDRGLQAVPNTSNQNDKFLGGRGLAGAKDVTGKNMLAKIGADSVGSSNGPINTKGSRSIATGPVVSDGEINGVANGKSLNFVQGKVSVNGLHSAGGSGSFGPGGSMSVSGNIDKDAVRRAIEKYMSKIRYCYERALLSKPSLSGSLKMEWSIQPGGRASGVRVVQSALNDATLHGCVSGVITTIPFPSPKGGPAQVNYPFSFTSSSI